MISRTVVHYATSAVVLGLLPVVLAHGEHGGHDDHGEVPPEGIQDSPEYPPSYFSHTEHVGVIYTHIALMTLAWVFVLPLGKFQIMFSCLQMQLAANTTL